MTKIYCDICGKECDDTTKFIVPIIVDSEVKGGIGDVVVWKGRMKGKTEMNMCEDCQNMNVDIVQYQRIVFQQLV